mgnify:CR=1 FL=1
MQALGMESGSIADSQIIASSMFNVYHKPARARLHTKELGLSTGTGGWSSLTNDLNQWLQVDLGKITNVTYIATQGRNHYSPSQWVKKYKIQFSDEGVSFLFYKRQGDSSDTVSSHINMQILAQLRNTTIGPRFSKHGFRIQAIHLAFNMKREIGTRRRDWDEIGY